ncbi:hypothetical protein C900_04816 [Fulvivirga imtechensis AK7]|uniref:histidine kinase n=1 Tax=Fulvivirga imtechensis AK7 TaxID=1237149 RepID=L8JKY1_9BACT|nr:hybrid sensor histidine kinase/response regulator transcription factor [Fulvivirga imtechensis]ELR69591.1 hypothetical protein C900_04816 [Fulvivirga imtechensis AK7]
MLLRLILIFFTCIYSSTATAVISLQPQNTYGLPHIQNYLPADHQGHPQSWWITQSREGLMYFANNMGVLEFDGVSWRTLALPDQKRAINVAIDHENNIYTTTIDDFGRFISDSKGKLVYKSLFADIKASYSDFGWMIDTWTTDDGVYFISAKYIFLLNRYGEYRVWGAEKQSFYKSFLVNDQLYVLKSGEGLQIIKNNVLIPLSGTDIFSKDKSLVLFSEDGKSLVIGRENGNFYKYHNSQLVHLFNLNTNYKVNASFQSLAVLQNDLWALATDQGIVLFNSDGNVKQVLNGGAGLPGSLITGLFLDRDKILWAVLDNGISKIHTSSPYTFFDKKSGISETAMEIIQHQGIIYCATTEGLLYLNCQSEKNTFHKIPGLKTPVWDLHSDGEILLAATSEGLFQIKNNKAHPVEAYTNNAFVIHPSMLDPKIFFIGGSFGLIVLKHTDKDTWERSGDITISKTADTFFWLYEEYPGRLWASGWTGGLYALTFNRGCTTNREDCLRPTIESYTIRNGLERGQENQMFRVKNHLVFASSSKILRFNKEQNRFHPDQSFNGIPLDSTSLILALKELQNGQVIVCSASPDECFLGTPDENGKYHWDSDYFFRLVNSPIYDIYSDGYHIWMSGANGVAHYDMQKEVPKDANFNTLIRKVSINSDSTLFFGQDLNYQPPILSYGINKLRLEFSATTYTDHYSTQFSYWLEGLDDEWSDWTIENQKDYTHLPEGDYTFYVKAKNVYGSIGSTDMYSFTILPPWYRTLWAYISYVVIVSFMIFGIVKWRSQQLEKDKKKLENIIQVRTAELARKNEQLKELDQMKSRFFANISHEFRTPLTLILGPLEQFLADRDVSSADYLRWQVMTKNAKRLQQLINQLLDLSKLESGKLTLHLKKGDVFRFVKAIAASFSSMGQSNRIQYTQNIPDESILAYFDPDKLEKIISNLLSNAFKFTESYGKVIIEAYVSSSQQEMQPGSSKNNAKEHGWLHIHVQDTGKGIKAHHLSKLFDRFYQADDSDTREKEGSGIGLALVKELVDLHGGTVEVESEENIGTIFKIALPIGKKYFTEEQVSEELHNAYEATAALTEEITEDISIETGEKLLPLVLIVEDNIDLRNYVKECLGHEYTYVEAMNGAEGLKKAQKHMPDLIITDLMMPGMGGTALCKKIKSDGLLGHIPVIMLTAKSGVGEKVDGLKTGADDYITKPFNVEELKVRVKNLMEQRKMLRERYQKEIRVLPGNVTVNSMDEQFLKKALAVVERSMSDPDFGIDHLLDALNTSRTHLHRKLKAITGQSASEFIRTIRLKRAAQLLEKDSNVISQIGYEVGFNDHSYFTKCFKKYFNMSPSEFAAQAKIKHQQTENKGTKTTD